MITLIFLLSGFFSAPADVPVNFRIGTAGNGSRVSMAYLEQHHFLKHDLEGYTIKSFRLSFDANGTVVDMGIQGADFAPALPKMKNIRDGSTIFVDQVQLISPDGKMISGQARFLFTKASVWYPEETGPFINWGDYAGGSTVSLDKLSSNDSLWVSGGDYRVLGFSVSFEVPGCIDKHVSGNRVPADILNMIQKVPPQRGLFFDNIRLRHTSGKETLTDTRFYR